MAAIIDGQKKPTPGHLAAGLQDKRVLDRSRALLSAPDAFRKALPAAEEMAGVGMCEAWLQLPKGREKRGSVAGKYHIRKYEERDYEMLCSFYIQGIREHIPWALWHFLSFPQTHLGLLSVFLLTYLSSDSYILSLVATSIFSVVGMLSMKSIWDDHLQHAFATDMMDIRKTYLEPKDSCFWVVDTGEEVVGMVAIIPPENPSWWVNARELKRMSVKKEHRGQGLSKALIKTVIQFSRERGYQEVVLGTTMVQRVAHRIYENMGFHKVLQTNPSFLAKLVGFSIYWYYYKIPDTH